MHTGRDVYRVNVSRGGKSYQLDVKEGGEVTSDQIAHAAKALKPASIN